LEMGTFVLHEKHDGDAGHEAPVQSPDQLLVQGSHLLFAEMSKRLEAALDLQRRDVAMFSRHLLELGTSHLLIEDVIRHLLVGTNVRHFANLVMMLRRVENGESMRSCEQLMIFQT
jgi:hypothetical protein